MIKVGKMQVNNNINPKIFLILCIFSCILFFIFGASTIINFIKTKDYVKILYKGNVAFISANSEHVSFTPI